MTLPVGKRNFLKTTIFVSTVSHTLVIILCYIHSNSLHTSYSIDTKYRLLAVVVNKLHDHNVCKVYHTLLRMNAQLSANRKLRTQGKWNLVGISRGNNVWYKIFPVAEST